MGNRAIIHLSVYILHFVSSLHASIITVPSREVIPPTVNSISKENHTLGSADPNGIIKPSDSQDSICGNSMIYVKSDEDPSTGTCKCKYGAMTSICVARPVVYWKPTNSCYPLYEQGPCNAEEWLIVNDEDMLECQRTDCPFKNTAPNETPSPTFSFVYNGTCYNTMHQSFCGPEEMVVFLGNLNMPTCVPHSSKLAHCYSASFGVLSLSTHVALPCEGGSRRSPDGTCTQSADF